MSNTIYTDDFQTTLFDIIKRYDGLYCNLMISGGSLLDILNYSAYEKLDSSKWSIYYADERVDPKGLNYTGSLPFLKMIKGSIFKINVEKKDCVEEYSQLLPIIDVCLLGIGPDGHICSLFPNTPSLDSQEKVIAITNPNVPFPDRVTTTLKFLNTQVKDLYFVIPPKDGKVKEIQKPHESIQKRLKKVYTSVLHSSLK